MEREDGKDPFDASTYDSPTSLNSMVELRVFCADFFDDHIRGDAETIDQSSLIRFVSLIASSETLFTRARAVVPELQSYPSPNETPHPNPNIQRVLQLTEDLRRLPPPDFGEHMEDVVWKRVAKDRRERRARHLGYLGNDSKGQSTRSGSPLIPHAPFKSEEVEIIYPEEDAKSADKKSFPYGPIGEKAADAAQRTGSKISSIPTPATPPVSSKSNKSIRKRSSALPTFVPREYLDSIQQLVWSPTSGTRERRPEELYNDALPLSISSVLNQVMSKTKEAYKETEPNTVPSNLRSTPQEMQRGGPRNFDFVPKDGLGLAMSLAQSQDHPSTTHRVQCNEDEGEKDDLSLTARSDREANLLRGNPDITNKVYETVPGSKQNWNPNALNITKAPSTATIKPYGDFVTNPLHALPSIPRFEGLHNAGQGSYGGPGSSSFTPQLDQIPRSDPVSFVVPPSSEQIPRSDARGSTFSPQFGPGPDARGGELRGNQISQPQMSQQMPDSGSASSPFQRQLDQVAYHNPNPRYVPSQQRASQFLGPAPPILSPAPKSYLRHQHSSSPPQSPRPTKENLNIPIPGSLSPIEYWDLLYRRETGVRARLLATGMTTDQREFVNRLSEARIATIASKLPPREPSMSPTDWLRLLRNELTTIWEQRPGDQPPTAIITARKSDYEMAVEREISFVGRELLMTGKEIGEQN